MWICLGMIALLTLVIVWRTAWYVRYCQLVSVANSSLEINSNSLAKARKAIAASLDQEVSPAELATYGGVTAAEFMWSWASIDPNLIAAADFASTENIHNGLDFVQYVNGHLHGLGAAAQEGFLNRLTGYYAEQQVATSLERAGHIVHVASESNQPIWDLIVDGHPVNVKAVADIASIKADALAHKDVLFMVPHDAHGEAVGNIVRVADLHHSALQESVHEGVAAAHGDKAMHALDMHIPIITIALAGYRNCQQVIRDGKDVDVAIQHFVQESVAKGGSIMFGGKLGAMAGTVVCAGIGTAIGAIIGAVGGCVAGGALARWWKSIPLKRAIADLERSLTALGKSVSEKIPQIRAMINKPIRHMEEAEDALKSSYKRRASRLNYILWPDAYTVFVKQSLVVAERSIAGMRARLRMVDVVIDKATYGDDWRPLGLLVASEPNIRQEIGVHKHLLMAVNSAKTNVHRCRRNLDPKFQPPAY